MFKPRVCVLHGSPCAPLVYPWLGEVEGTSLAMTQAKASPVPGTCTHVQGVSGAPTGAVGGVAEGRRTTENASTV